MTDDNRRRNIASEVEEADRCLVAADTLIAAQLHKDALNRLYYACFHLASALLLTEGREVRTHRGLRELADYDRGFVATPELVADERAAAGSVRVAVTGWLAQEAWWG